MPTPLGANLRFGPFPVRAVCRLAGQLIPVADAADRVSLSLKMRTVEAVIQPNGEVLLVEPVPLASPRRALVTSMEEAPHPHDAALLSEAAMGEDWNRPEEDAARAHLQPGKSSQFTYPRSRGAPDSERLKEDPALRFSRWIRRNCLLRARSD